MPNRLIKKITATLSGTANAETFDIYDENAFHTSDLVNNVTNTFTGSPLDSYQGKVLNDRITSEISARQSSYEELSDSLSDEISTRSSAVNSLSSRMDTFTTLPSGSTSGDAELIDIRTGETGVVYSNAGTAVRSQIASLRETIDTIAGTASPLYGNKVTLTATSERYKYTIVPYGFRPDETYRITVKMDIPAPKKFGISTSNTYTYVDTYVAYFPQGNTSTTFFLKPTASAAHLYLMLDHTAVVNYTVEIETGTFDEIKDISDAAMVEVSLSTLKYTRGWIRYTNGELVGSEATCTYILRKQDFPTYIKAKLTNESDALAAIAFYNTDTISTSGYMKSDSVQFYSGSNHGGIWYSASVPANCKIMTVTTIRTSYAADIATPVLLRTVASKKAERGTDFLYKPCYDHLFVSTHGNDIVIPHESLYHIRISRRLGFNMFELNVARTSDYVYVVNHFTQKKFGDYFHHVDGSTDISNTLVSSVTWEWIVNNVRYNSTIPKYQTRPCRLEEALAECKQQNLTPLIEMADVDTIRDIADLADEYMGKGNYVAYGAARTYCPDAAIFDGGTGYTNISDILAYCDIFKPPFYYSLLNVSDFSDSELKAVIDALHINGYKVATSYSDVNWYKLRSLGFDLNGTQLLINRIDNGNICNYESIFGFSNFTYTNATLSNGVLTFSGSGTISPNIANTTYDLCGFDVELWFTGTIKVNAIGEFYGATYTSDGSLPVYVAAPVINGSPKVTMTCNSGTVIRDIKFKASVF